MAKKGKTGKRRKFTWDTAAKIAAFVTGVAAGVGGNVAANKLVEMATDKPLAPVADAIVGGVTGAAVPSVTAVSPKLRKLTLVTAAGGFIGGAAPGIIRLVREKMAEGTRGSGNAGQNIRKAIGAGNAGQNIAARFRLRTA